MFIHVQTSKYGETFILSTLGSRGPDPDKMSGTEWGSLMILLEDAS